MNDGNVLWLISIVRRIFKWKTDIEWVGDDVISYRNRQKYQFDEIASGKLSQEDEVVILNPVWNVSKLIFCGKFVL